MKIDFVKTIIAVAISCLIAYGFYAICKVDELRWLLTIVSGVAMTITLAFTLGIKPKAERTAVMFTTMSSIFFVGRSAKIFASLPKSSAVLKRSLSACQDTLETFS